MRKIREQVQKLGRSMLLPVAAMPLAGLMMRLSAGDMLNISLLGAAGNAVFNNLDYLFAIGVVIGFTNAKDRGIPALTAFLALATLKAGLHIMDASIDMGIFGGILSGLVAAWSYNHFKEQKLPMVFSYFAGEKFPLTVVMLLQTVMSFLLGYIWPTMQSGIDHFAKMLEGMGAFGVGLYMFLNRILIPFGLHHVLNTYVYFELGSYTAPDGQVFRGEITRFIHGDPTAGLFLSGFFVVMMFGVPAICLAIYRAARQGNKAQVKGMMGGNALTSFVANITEPTEFSFMFLSPVLYFIHALLAGFAGIVCYYLNIHLGFTFGACIIDYLINFRIAKNAILILPVGVVFFALYYTTFYYLICKMKLPTPGREAEMQFSEVATESEELLTLASKNYPYISRKLLEALGGSENIEDAFSCNTRLRIQVKEPSLVDENRIKLLGVSGIVKPSENHYQIIIGLNVTYVMAEMERLLNPS